jgi:ribosomal protein L11 methylase PrmA
LKTLELSSIALEQVTGNFSLLTANLILSEIVEILPHVHRLLEPKGYLIVSGILIDQVEKVISVLREYQFSGPETSFKDEWGCIISKKGNET